MSRVWVLILPLVVEWASCAQRWLPRPADPVSVGSAGGHIRLAASIEGGGVVAIAVSPDPPQQRTLVRIDSTGERSLSLSGNSGGCIGEALVAPISGKWWYSRCTTEGVQFADADGVSIVDPEVADQWTPREWLPFTNGAPGGVLLIAANDERRVTARCVTPTSVSDCASFWHDAAWTSSSGQAARLLNGRMAIATIEAEPGEPAATSLFVRTIDQDGTVETAKVFQSSGWASVAIAARADGLVGIVAAPFDGSGVVALTLDGQSGSITGKHALSGDEASVPRPGLRLTVQGNRFVANWVQVKDGSIMIGEFDERMSVGPVRIGDDVTPYSPCLSNQTAATTDGGNEVVAFWTRANGSTAMRRMPEPAGGSVIASEILADLSRWLSGNKRLSSSGR